ncbi:hypothetical protein SeLEV6574_g01487 [Synchytrium endobioticum]|uniref:Uncharacterized protein n=1 Tax=Synchytrium endobioticum TaxID=286115 RepID=A0A507DCK6_9FUNG|nr:hypothetical protein SeLEV6574_g01487 [Synchytrium endobioticum]
MDLPKGGHTCAEQGWIFMLRNLSTSVTVALPGIAPLFPRNRDEINVCVADKELINGLYEQYGLDGLASYSQAIRSSSKMLPCFLIVLVLWHKALPSSAEITDEEYRFYAQQLHEYRHGITFNQKQLLEGELADLYSKWKNPNDPYGSGITSITELRMQKIIPVGIPFTVEDARYPLNEKPPCRNEFVWEGIRTLNDFAYVGVDDVHREELEGLRALATTAEECLKAQIRSQFFPYADVSGLIAMSSEVTRTYLALESYYRPYVSSFTQVELIKMNWLNWCVDELNINEKLARLTEMDKNTPHESGEKWVEALVFSELAAGRIALIQSALENFNLYHRSILVAQLVNEMDVLGEAFASYAQAYRSLTWRHVLGKPTRQFFGEIDSALATAPLQYEHEADPRTVEEIPDYVVSLFHLLPTPENVPPEYLELATRFHKLVCKRGWLITGKCTTSINGILGDASIPCQKYGDAYAASLPYSAGSTDHLIWAERRKDAQQLRRTYAKAVDARYSSYAESLREYSYGMTVQKQVQLEDELRALYSKWISSNDPYSITSITGLLIDRIIPEGIPLKEEHVREPTDDMSLAHNEFVWEGLMALDRLAYLFVDDVYGEVQNVKALEKAYEERLKDQIRLALGGSNDLFSPSDFYDMFDLNAKVTRVNEALISGTIPMVSSVIQAEFIYRYWPEWCIGNTAAASYQCGRYYYCSELVKALAFLQLAVGRMQVMEWSLSAFLEQRKQLPQTDCSNHEMRKWEWIVATMRHTTKKYQRVTDFHMKDWTSRWTDVLGEDVGPHLAVVEFAFKRFRRKRKAQDICLAPHIMKVLELLPIPENVPRAYLRLAARFHEIQYSMRGDLSSMQLRDIYETAASAAASLSGGAGLSSNPVMDERVGVSSAAAGDHSSSTDDLQWLSLDASRTMTKHGQTPTTRFRG